MGFAKRSIAGQAHGIAGAFWQSLLLLCSALFQATKNPARKIVLQDLYALAEAYRSRTYLGPHSPTSVLKTERHTGADTPPNKGVLRWASMAKKSIFGKA
jgi:hypothetical protein